MNFSFLPNKSSAVLVLRGSALRLVHFEGLLCVAVEAVSEPPASVDVTVCAAANHSVMVRSSVFPKLGRGQLKAAVALQADALFSALTADGSEFVVVDAEIADEDKIVVGLAAMQAAAAPDIDCDALIAPSIAITKLAARLLPVSDERILLYCEEDFALFVRAKAGICLEQKILEGDEATGHNATLVMASFVKSIGAPTTVLCFGKKPMFHVENAVDSAALDWSSVMSLPGLDPDCHLDLALAIAACEDGFSSGFKKAVLGSHTPLRPYRKSLTRLALLSALAFLSIASLGAAVIQKEKTRLRDTAAILDAEFAQVAVGESLGLALAEFEKAQLALLNKSTQLPAHAASDLFSWLSSLADSGLISAVRSLRYEVQKWPELDGKHKKTAGRIELEFDCASAEKARRLQELFKQTDHHLVDTKNGYKWTGTSSPYKVSFAIKDPLKQGGRV